MIQCKSTQSDTALTQNAPCLHGLKVIIIMTTIHVFSDNFFPEEEIF